MGSEVVDFECVHGGFGFGKRNVKGEMILEVADALVANIWFKNKRRLLTYVRIW